MATQPDPHVTLIWRKSSASGGDSGCVEVAKFGSSVLVRDSRARSGTILEFSTAGWRSFVRCTKDGGAALG